MLELISQKGSEESLTLDDSRHYLSPAHLAEAGVTSRAELLDAEVLGLGLELQQLPPGVGEWDLAIS